MKKLLLALMLSCISNTSSFAFDYETARPLAWYLTDKMAYELDLTIEQCDYVYQINLNYFLQVSSPSDLYGRVVTCRNEDLGYVLTATQYAAYQGRNYFEAPLTYSEYGWLLPVLEYYEQSAYFLSESAPAYYGNFQGSPRLRAYNEQSPFRGVRLSEDTGLRSGNMQRGFGQNGTDITGSSASSSDSRFNQAQNNNAGTIGNSGSYNQQQSSGTGTHPNRFQSQGTSGGDASNTRGSGNLSSSQNSGAGIHPNRFGGQTNSGNNGNLRDTGTGNSRFNSQGSSSSGDFSRSTSGNNNGGSAGTHPNRFKNQGTGGGTNHTSGTGGNLKSPDSGNSRFKSNGTSSNDSSRFTNGNSSSTGSTPSTNRFKK